MTSVSEQLQPESVRVLAEQRVYPRYDAFHGTPDPMIWRRVTVETPRGSAAFEQTDYGHPGRWNGWQPRGIDQALLPRLSQLESLVETAAAFL